MAKLPDHLGHVSTAADRAGGITVTLTANTAAFQRAMQNAVDTIARAFASPAVRHWMEHHAPEEPTISAMHAEYHRRSKARRRRRR
jgi:hypothetical protein